MRRQAHSSEIWQDPDWHGVACCSMEPEWDAEGTCQDTRRAFLCCHDEPPLAPAPYKHSQTACSSGAGQLRGHTGHS